MRAHRSWLVLVACLFAACGGESATAGANEPFRVEGGAFKAGKLPGAAARDRNAEPEVTPAKLSITALETNDLVLHPGQIDKRFSGRATEDGYAIALRFAEFGSGYWVRPLAESDSAYPGELSFRVDVDFEPELPLGKHKLLFTVIDGAGRAGRQQSLEVCVVEYFDRTLHACDPTQKPPAAVVRLHWDSAADLDLSVRTPDGDLIDARHPATQTDAPETRGILYANQSTACAANAAQREELVFASDVPEGRYSVYVNLFDACDVPATYFEVNAYGREELGDGTFSFDTVQSTVVGEVLAAGANAGRNEGVWVADVDFP